MYRYFMGVSGVDTVNYIYFWKFKGLSDEMLQQLLQVIIVSNHN